MAKLTPPFSTAVVDVPGESVEKFKAQGWRDAPGPSAKSEPEKAERRTSRRD